MNEQRRKIAWSVFFTILALANVITIILPYAFLYRLVQLAKSGHAGTEFLALALIPLQTIGLIVAGLNAVSITWYLLGNNRSKLSKYVGYTIVALSMLWIVIFGMPILQSFFEYKLLIGDRKPIQVTTQNISQEKAIELLNNCDINRFYYTNQTKTEDGNDGGELSPTGIVLTNLDGTPFELSIANRLIPILLPVARSVQEICNGHPQLWHDGGFENGGA